MRTNRWIQTQQIGVLSYALSVLPVTANHFENARLALLSVLDTKDRVGELDRFLIGMPEWVQTSLHNSLDNQKVGQRLRAFVPRVSAVISSENNEVRRGAQVWVYHALLDRTDARRLLRLGKSLFGTTWTTSNAESRDVLSNELRILRNPWSPTIDKFESVETLSEAFANLDAWVQIENLLYSYQYYWPLLILDDPAGGLAQCAVSLPVGVDVQFDGRNDVATGALDTGLSVKAWIPHLRRAAKTAKLLWRSKHGNHQDFRFMVADASVLFDFRQANATVGPFLGHVFGNVSLKDSSAETYFTQTVLNKLLGRCSMSPSAITGHIGTQIVGQDGKPYLNWNFGAPEGIKEKLRFVFSSGMFQRAVLPTGTEKQLEESLSEIGSNDSSQADQTRLGDQNVETLFASDLATVADIVQIFGWRQTTYIRCPEVAWGVHSVGRPGLISRDSQKIERLLKQLALNEHTIIELDATAIEVASALWHVKTAAGKRSNAPPSLSWAFVRPLSYPDLKFLERDSAFWQLLWPIFGAGAEDFYLFARQGNVDEAVHQLAGLFNCFEPTLAAPGQRTPDILVILDSDVFREDLDKEVFTRPLRVEPILDRLGQPGVLLGPHDNRLMPFIGHTRIILLKSERQAAHARRSELDRLDSTEMTVLRELAVFEFGCTQQQAALLLGEIARGQEVRNILRNLVQKRVLHYGQGRYHLPAGIRNLLLHDSPRRQAWRHYRAGIALAPYVRAEIQFPSLALDIAFNPEYIHEAEVHFRLAMRYSLGTDDRNLFGFSRDALAYLKKFIGVPSWSIVKRLLSDGMTGYAYEMAEELITWEEKQTVKSDYYANPTHLLLFAEAASLWAKTLNGAKNKSSAKEMKEKAEVYYSKALKASPLFPRPETTRLAVLSSFVSHLIEQDPERQDDIRQSAHDIDLLLIEGKAETAMMRPYFELLGDFCQENETAFEYYNRGLQYFPRSASLWIQAFGSASLLSPSQNGKVQALKSKLTPESSARVIKHINSWGGRHNKKVGKGALRWAEGARLLKELLRPDRLVRAASPRKPAE